MPKSAKPQYPWMFKHFMPCDLDMDFFMQEDVKTFPAPKRDRPQVKWRCPTSRHPAKF